MSTKKQKLITILTLIVVLLASVIVYCGYRISEEKKRCEGLKKEILFNVGSEFLQIAPPKVFKSYSQPYPITVDRIKYLRYQKLTEENTDAFLYEFYYHISAIEYDISHFDYYCSEEEQEKLLKLYELMRKLQERYEAISKMTNKTWRVEALEELIFNTKDDLKEIGLLLHDDKLSEAVEIAANGNAAKYLNQPAYPIEVGVDKYEHELCENVTFWLKNKWDRTIELSVPPFIILKDMGLIHKIDDYIHTSKWKKIYEPNTTRQIYLKPGETRTWKWNQRDINNRQVNDGCYKVVFSVTGWAENTYSASFVIGKGCIP